jgi:DNA-binding transcriptional regulator YhcF (GntR family)
MQVSLNKNSDILLHQQLAEQIVFLITTRVLGPDEALPSVRALVRQLGIHHNTVSKAYRDLVGRGWLQRQPGSRLRIKGAGSSASGVAEADLDELINQSIRHARKAGYSLKALRDRVLERLAAQAPDYILLVERESELRQILQTEIQSAVGRPVEACAPEELGKAPDLVIGAQVVAPDYLLPSLNAFVPKSRPGISLTFAPASEHLALIRGLKEPSIIGVASISKSLLKTARGLLAPVLGRRHPYKEFLLPAAGRGDLRGIDIAFCDSVVISRVRCKQKIHYRLIAGACLEDILSVFG